MVNEYRLLRNMEPSPVFDPLALATSAEAKGDKFVLTGKKRFVVMGDRADELLVVARQAAAVKGGFASLDAFIVPRGAAGVAIGEREKLLGMKALPAVSLTLDRVEVPAANRLGGERGIDAKRLRYGVDGFASLFRARCVEDYLGTLEALQDVARQRQRRRNRRAPAEGPAAAARFCGIRG